MSLVTNAPGSGVSTHIVIETIWLIPTGLGWALTYAYETMFHGGELALAAGKRTIEALIDNNSTKTTVAILVLHIFWVFICFSLLFSPKLWFLV
jgi:hypothetical protein